MDVKKRMQGETRGLYLDAEMLKAAELYTAEEYLVVFGTGAIVVTDGKTESIVLAIVDLLWNLKREEREEILAALTTVNQYYTEE